MNISNMQYKVLLLHQMATNDYLQAILLLIVGDKQEAKKFLKKASGALEASKSALEIMSIFEEEEED